MQTLLSLFGPVSVRRDGDDTFLVDVGDVTLALTGGLDRAINEQTGRPQDDKMARMWLIHAREAKLVADGREIDLGPGVWAVTWTQATRLCDLGSGFDGEFEIPSPPGSVTAAARAQRGQADV